MQFTKMEGAGNDYVYVDARNQERDWAELSRRMSDRHFGVGSDGLILIADSEVADLKMVMFNADGSQGEMCGNGIRCFAKYALERDIAAPSEDGLTVETLAGIRTVLPTYDGSRITGARVAMGAPILSPTEVPVTLGEELPPPVLEYPFGMDGHKLPLSFVSMGNPHAVTFIEQPVADFPLLTVGPKVEHHPMFPRRVNFEIVKVDAPGRLTARVWERGSGETLACGTGACAIAVAARLSGHCGDEVDIMLPGGTLRIHWGRQRRGDDGGPGDGGIHGGMGRLMTTAGTKRLTFEEWQALPVTKQRCEVLDGVLLMPPAPLGEHYWVSNLILGELMSFLTGRGLGMVFHSPVDVLIGREPLRVRQPDILVVNADLTGIARPADLAGLPFIERPPLLVVEVLSPSNTPRDIEQRLSDYRSIGVPECWLASFENRTIEVWRLPEDSMVLATTFEMGDTLVSQAMTGFEQAVDDVFGPLVAQE